MNVANLELCKELYDLTGWESDHTWAANGSGLKFIVRSNDGELGHDIYRLTYAYDLGYLMRNLPTSSIIKKHNRTGFSKATGDYGAYIWKYKQEKFRVDGDTPEDAACRLAIQLAQKRDDHYKQPQGHSEHSPDEAQGEL